MAGPAFYDTDRSRAEAFAAKTGATVCGDEDEVPGRLRRRVHLHMDLRASPSGGDGRSAPTGHLLRETPLATDLAGATAMAEVGPAGPGVVNQVGTRPAASPPPSAGCGSSISEPKSGRVMSVMFRDDQYIPLQGMYKSTWRGDVARAVRGLCSSTASTMSTSSNPSSAPWPPCRASPRSSTASRASRMPSPCRCRSPAGRVGSLLSVWHDILERESSRYVEVICENLWCAIDTDDWWGPVRWARTNEEPGTLEGRALGESVWMSAGLAPCQPR